MDNIKRYKKGLKYMFKICLLLSLMVFGIENISMVKVSAAGNPYPQTYVDKGVYHPGNCTWQVWEEAKNRLGIELPNWGDAGGWCARARNAGYTVVDWYNGYVPPNDCIIEWAGHVGWLLSADSVGVNIREGNILINGSWQDVHEQWWSWDTLRAYRGNPKGVIILKNNALSLTINNVADGDILYGTSMGISGTVKNGGLYPWLELFMDYGYVDTTYNNEYGNYAFYLDTTKYDDGKHLLGVKIKNQNGLDFTLWRNIYINNSNFKSISGQVGYTVKGIEDNKVISGNSMPISGSVMGGGKYPWLELYVDYGYVDTTYNNEYGNYAFYLDTTKYSNGYHMIGIKLKNQDGYDYTTWFLVKVNNKIDSDTEATGPSEKPTSSPTLTPTPIPTPVPTMKPIVKPTISPTVKPTTRPVVNQTVKLTPKSQSDKNVTVKSTQDTYRKEVSTLGITTVMSCKSDKHGKVCIKWYKIASANGYQIQYSTKKNFGRKKAKVVYGSNKIKLKLKANKKYYVRIRAFKYGNIQYKVYGKWSSKVKVRTKK